MLVYLLSSRDSSDFDRIVILLSSAVFHYSLFQSVGEVLPLT